MAQKVPLGWLRPLESLWMRVSNRRDAKPRMVILLALPRSGSTLTYQVLVHGLKPVYLSNIGNLFYQVPLFGGLVSKRRCAGYRSDFRSSQGFVTGACGPAEGLRFWSYWCSQGLDELDVPAIGEKTLVRREEHLRRVFSCLSSRSSPYVTGYLGHVLAWERLRSLFPEALFVRLHRDPVSNALSLLRSRPNEDDGWFSVRPKECDGLEARDRHFQVAAQVYWLNKRLQGIAKDDVVHLQYEDLCRNPSVELDRVASACNARGMTLSPSDDLPASFEYKVADPACDQDAARIRQALDELESKHGVL